MFKILENIYLTYSIVFMYNVKTKKVKDLLLIIVQYFKLFHVFVLKHRYQVKKKLLHKTVILFIRKSLS